jgi:hypothetical protein
MGMMRGLHPANRAASAGLCSCDRRGCKWRYRRSAGRSATAAGGIWPVLKGGVLANLAVASFGHLIQVIRHGLKKIQYRPHLIDGCLARTGLALEPGETPNGHQELKTFNQEQTHLPPGGTFLKSRNPEPSGWAYNLP